jgi:hypothetical protein
MEALRCYKDKQVAVAVVARPRWRPSTSATLSKVSDPPAAFGIWSSPVRANYLRSGSHGDLPAPLPRHFRCSGGYGGAVAPMPASYCCWNSSCRQSPKAARLTLKKWLNCTDSALCPPRKPPLSRNTTAGARSDNAVAEAEKYVRGHKSGGEEARRPRARPRRRAAQFPPVLSGTLKML